MEEQVGWCQWLVEMGIGIELRHAAMHLPKELKTTPPQVKPPANRGREFVNHSANR